jgi:pimeloyl-ACP methyl ester carboxylesterase
MKKFSFFILIIFFTVKTLAQAEPAGYAAAMSRFTQFYNHDKPDSIFSMFSPEMKAALPLDKFKPTTQQLKSQYGSLVKTEFVKYGESLAVYKATFENSVFLLNISLNAQNKLTGLLLSPYQEAPTQQGLVIDPALTESPVLVKTLTGTVSGSLVTPKNISGKIPVVLIIADAGPIDRDGNNPKAGIAGNTYKLLANGLGKSGIATLRYDKRFAGSSVTTVKESQLSMEDYGDDAVSLINMLNDDPRFSKIILFGHGEGTLVAMMATLDEPIKGLISAEGPGEPADKMLTDQMKSKTEFIAGEFKAILDSLRKGKTTPNVDPALYYIAAPSKQHFLMSWCRLVPQRGMKRMKMPVMIINGTTDLQVPVDNAEKLKKAKSDAVLLIINGMNHILKEAPADPDQNMATFNKPDLPLKPELVTGIVDFINKLK